MKKGGEIIGTKEVFMKEKIPHEAAENNKLDLPQTDTSQHIDHDQPCTSKSRKSKHHSDRHSRSRHTHDSKTRENKKFKQRKEKLKLACEQKLQMRYEAATNESTQADKRSIISKNRLTQAVGIYNKGKSSDTIYRERRRSQLVNKLKQKTEEDLSKVLDCSSFQIEPLNVTASEILVDGHKIQQTEPASSSTVDQEPTVYTSTSPQERNDIHSTSMMASTSDSDDVHKVQYSLYDESLPLEIPLAEITQRLMGGFNPEQVFQRDYLGEICTELTSYWRKNWSLLHGNDCDMDTPQQAAMTPNNCATPVQIGSRNHPGRKLFTLSIDKIEHMARRNAQVTFLDNSPLEICGVSNNENNDQIREETPPAMVTSNSPFFDQTKLSLHQAFPSEHENYSQKENTPANHRPIDILSILDQSLRCTDKINVFDIDSPDKYGDVSPLRKPSLDIMTPQEKLLPRKLF